MIPRIIKGSGITGAIRYNMGEGRDKLTNERLGLEPGAISRSEILGGQNFGFEVNSAERIELARRLMEFSALPENQTAKTRKCTLDCLHMSLSWARGQEPTNAEKLEAAQSALRAIGMDGAQAVFFSHSDMPQSHIHIVASRINPATGKAFSDTMDNAKAIGWSLRWEREHGQITENRRDLHALADAARGRDMDRVLDLVTARNPTFQAKDIKLACMYGELPEKDVRELTTKALASERVIGLRETTEGPVKRYTTREVLAEERQVQASARNLAADQTHAVDTEHRRDAAIKHGLNKEQAEALHRATGQEGLTIVAGQAGAGKSRAMGAIRDAYEAQGYRVIGLSPQNKIVEEMRAKGFERAATVHAELGLKPDGKHADPARAPSAKWDSKTVIMVDEAAMLATKDLAMLAQRAEQAGAKLLLAGDDKQIQSIERGGMFGPLKNEHGAARIDEVQRNKNQSQRDAWGLAHAGEFGPALKIFDQDKMLHWAATAPAAEAALLQRFAADFKAEPSKSRFIFAHTNEQVDRLNSAARGLMREAGKLGPDVTIATKTGPQTFATGDRIQFTGNGGSRQGIQAGFVNGAAGTITSIREKDGQLRLAVQMDSGKELRFGVGTGKTEFNAFRPGYAGTIFKGQGASIGQTYSLVSKGWDAALSYVAMTRHTDGCALFIAKDVALDREALAKVMSRDANRQAASGFALDPLTLQRSGLERTEAAAKTAKTAAPAKAEAGKTTADRAGKGTEPPIAAKATQARQERARRPGRRKVQTRRQPRPAPVRRAGREPLAWRQPPPTALPRAREKRSKGWPPASRGCSAASRD